MWKFNGNMLSLGGEVRVWEHLLITCRNLTMILKDVNLARDS